MGGGGGRAGVIIVKQEVCVFNCKNCMNFNVNLGGGQNFLWGKHALLASMQINP